MADVFLSYVREDRSRAHQLVTVLGQLGLNVWWDEKILPGRPYREVIAEELASAKCVVVLWSQVSVRSDYVCDEAEEAKHRLVLVPVLIESVQPRHGFRQQNLADLLAWTGDPDDPQFTLLRKAILSHVLSRATEVSSTPSAGKAPVPAKNVGGAYSHPAPTRHFESDVFISFAHFDDQAAIEGQPGWVTSLHGALEVRLGQLLGRQPRDALQALNGYNFYTSEHDTGRHLELGPMSPVDVQELYWMKVDEVAQDIAALLMILEDEAPEADRGHLAR